MEEQKRFYWLKLKRDFFKRHDIQIIENMPNGKDYVLFYLKLMCESIDHDGNLRFSDTIPYNEQMLSTITNTNVDIVRAALSLLRDLNMVDILDDQTIYMREVNKMIGSAVDNDNANRQRRFRERQKELQLCECYEPVTENNESKRIELDKEKDIEIDIQNTPSSESDEAECEEQNEDPKQQMFDEFWKAYPRKVDKKGAARSFFRIKGLTKAFPQIMEALEKCKKSQQWIKDGGNFIPHPTTWINQERWLSVIDNQIEKQSSFDIDDYYEAALRRTYGENVPRK